MASGYISIVLVDDLIRAVFTSVDHYTMAVNFRDKLVSEPHTQSHKYIVQIWPVDDPKRGYFNREGVWAEGHGFADGYNNTIEKAGLSP